MTKEQLVALALRQLTNNVGPNRYEREITEIQPYPRVHEGRLLAETDLSKLSRICDNLALHLIEFGNYCDWRGGNGTGDHGDAKAKEMMGKRYEKVRKALGYHTATL